MQLPPLPFERYVVIAERPELEQDEGETSDDAVAGAVLAQIDDVQKIIVWDEAALGFYRDHHRYDDTKASVFDPYPKGAIAIVREGNALRLISHGGAVTHDVDSSP